MTPRPDLVPDAPTPRRSVARRRVTAMTWVVLGLVPVLWIVELTGPEWLNLGLRGLWVVVAVGTVAAGLVLWARERRAASGVGAGARRS